MKRHGTAGSSAAARNGDRNGELVGVTKVAVDDVTDEQHASGEDGEVAAVAWHHRKKCQTQYPQWKGGPVDYYKNTEVMVT